MREPRILVEGYLDILLVETLVKRTPHRAGTRSKVIITLLQKIKNQKAIGLIDKDKPKGTNTIKYIQLLEKGDRIEHFEYTPQPKKRIMMIIRNNEEWLWETAEKSNVDASKYGIKSLKHFMSISKSPNILKNKKVKEFINTLLWQKNSPLKTLQNWIENHLDLY